MLEHLFGSRTRVKLLTLFLHNPEKVFYVRELTRRIDTQINAVRREIDNLVKMGLLAEGTGSEPDEDARRPGIKRKYYMINASFPLYDEVRTLLTKAYVLHEWNLPEKIFRLGDVRYLALMGMFVGLKNQPVDVFIVGELNRDALKDVMKEV